MFKLAKLFLKETFIAFYKEKELFNVQKRVIKNDKVILNEEFKLNGEELLSFIKSAFIENTQTYVSTIIDTFNQGCVNSCSHSKYKEIGINIENIKILCLKEYSIFIGIYELNEFIKQVEPYKVDFVFSPYLIISSYNKNSNNSVYLLISDNFIAITIYETSSVPLYSNIYQIKIDNNENNNIDDNKNLDEDIDDIDEDIDLIDDIDDIDDLEDLEDLDENIDEDIDDIDDLEEDNDESENIQKDMSEIKNELDTIEFIKNSIKDYYEDYSDNFLENLYILHKEPISEKFIENIKNETFLNVTSEKINFLSNINDLALKETNV